MKHAGPALVDSLREAVRSLTRARLRTVLGLVGIAIGIASVIAMVSAGEIATAEARKQFEALGTDIVTVETAQGYRGPGIAARRRARPRRGAAGNLGGGADGPGRRQLRPCRKAAGRRLP